MDARKTQTSTYVLAISHSLVEKSKYIEARSECYESLHALSMRCDRSLRNILAQNPISRSPFLELLAREKLTFSPSLVDKTAVFQVLVGILPKISYPLHVFL